MGETLPGAAPLPLSHSLATGDAAWTLGFGSVGLGLCSHWDLKERETAHSGGPVGQSHCTFLPQMPLLSGAGGPAPQHTYSRPWPGLQTQTRDRPLHLSHAAGTRSDLPPGSPTLCLFMSSHLQMVAEWPSHHGSRAGRGPEPSHDLLLPLCLPTLPHILCSGHRRVFTVLRDASSHS